MSPKTYNNLKRGSLPLLKKTNTVLTSYKQKPYGEVVWTTRYKNQVEDVQVFAVHGVESVFSGNTCIKLGLLKRVHQFTRQNPRARVELDDFPKMFTGLGCLPGTDHIELTGGAVPVFHPLRKVPIPQRQKFIEELKMMEKLGAIVRQVS